jgi:hypothetical protein
VVWCTGLPFGARLISVGAGFLRAWSRARTSIVVILLPCSLQFLLQGGVSLPETFPFCVVGNKSDLDTKVPRTLRHMWVAVARLPLPPARTSAFIVLLCRCPLQRPRPGVWTTASPVDISMYARALLRGVVMLLFSHLTHLVPRQAHRALYC